MSASSPPFAAATATSARSPWPRLVPAATVFSHTKSTHAHLPNLLSTSQRRRRHVGLRAIQEDHWASCPRDTCVSKFLLSLSSFTTHYPSSPTGSCSRPKKQRTWRPRLVVTRLLWLQSPSAHRHRPCPRRPPCTRCPTSPLLFLQPSNTTAPAVCKLPRRPS